MKGAGYTVEETEFGVLVRGPVPADDFSALCGVWEKRGLTELLMGVASALGASFAVARKESVKPWIEAVSKRAVKASNGSRELEWLHGPDTGMSSKTIFSVLSEHGAYVLDRWGPREPSDPDDFGRCYRLLEFIPGWRPRLGEVAAKHPEWAPLVAAWDEMERLFEEEAPSGRAPKLYAFMQKLLERRK